MKKTDPRTIIIPMEINGDQVTLLYKDLLRILTRVTDRKVDIKVTTQIALQPKPKAIKPKKKAAK